MAHLTCDHKSFHDPCMFAFYRIHCQQSLGEDLRDIACHATHAVYRIDWLKLFPIYLFLGMKCSPHAERLQPLSNVYIDFIILSILAYNNIIAGIL